MGGSSGLASVVSEMVYSSPGGVATPVLVRVAAARPGSLTQSSSPMLSAPGVVLSPRQPPHGPKEHLLPDTLGCSFSHSAASLYVTKSFKKTQEVKRHVNKEYSFQFLARLI